MNTHVQKRRSEGEHKDPIRMQIFYFNKKRFDKECLLKTHELRKLANKKKHRDPLNITEKNTVTRS